MWPGPSRALLAKRQRLASSFDPSESKRINALLRRSASNTRAEQHLEVKQAAARQSWDGKSLPLRRNAFDIAPRKGYWTRQNEWVTSPGRRTFTSSLGMGVAMSVPTSATPSNGASSSQRNRTFPATRRASGWRGSRNSPPRVASPSFGKRSRKPTCPQAERDERMNQGLERHRIGSVVPWRRGVGIVVSVEVSAPSRGAGNGFLDAISSSAWRFATRILAQP